MRRARSSSGRASPLRRRPDTRSQAEAERHLHAVLPAVTGAAPARAAGRLPHPARSVFGVDEVRQTFVLEDLGASALKGVAEPMAGNRTLVLETTADPDALVVGEAGETLALRAYPQTNLTAKTAVVVYRDEPDGFIITAWLTSRADRVRAKGVQVWSRSPSTSA